MVNVKNMIDLCDRYTRICYTILGSFMMFEKFQNLKQLKSIYFKHPGYSYSHLGLITTQV